MNKGALPETTSLGPQGNPFRHPPGAYISPKLSSLILADVLELRLRPTSHKSYEHFCCIRIKFQAMRLGFCHKTNQDSMIYPPETNTSHLKMDGKGRRSFHFVAVKRPIFRCKIHGSSFQGPGSKGSPC